MKTYEIIIKPLSGFGTPLKGDTIFGHFCWQVANDDGLTGKHIDNLLLHYKTRPFAVFSSAYPTFCVGNTRYFAFKTPSLPLDWIFNLPNGKKEIIEKRKEFKKMRWMILERDKNFTSFKELRFVNDSKLLEDIKAYTADISEGQAGRRDLRNFVEMFSQPHNKINRLTSTTGIEGFAPFSVEQHVFYPETELVLFVGVDKDMITIDQVNAALERVGMLGFGKDASTGLGRFDVIGTTEINLANMGSDSPNACYTLAPCVPEKDTFTEMFFTPFTRFGRHGDVLAKSSNPFKNPVIMADEGGIFKPKMEDVFQKPYIGTAATNISKTEPKSVAQGYSLYIPVNVEV